MNGSPFSAGEVVGASALAVFVQGAVLALAIAAGNHEPQPKAQLPRELSVAIQPVDDLPLLKKGKPKAPKQPSPPKAKPPPKAKEPAPSTPTPKAKREPPKPPPKERKSKPRPAPEEPEPEQPDTAKAERVNELIEKMRRQAAADSPAEESEGAEHGSDDGTESDPLKARAVNLYRSKLIQWFKRGFEPTVEGAPCEQLRSLQAQVAASIGPRRQVTRFVILEKSGNPDFDGRVRSRMEQSVGKVVPPPPPKYPDILNQQVRLVFSGKDAQCD